MKRKRNNENDQNSANIKTKTAVINNTNNAHTPPSSPFKLRDHLSPSGYNTQITLPNEKFRNDLAKIETDLPDLHSQILKTVKKIYYPVLERNMKHPKGLTAGTAALREEYTGEDIGGKKHHVKTANHQNIIKNLLKEFSNSADDAKTLQTEVYAAFCNLRSYFSSHLKTSQTIISQMSSSKKAHIEEYQNVDCYVDVPKKTYDEHTAITAYHGKLHKGLETPKKITKGTKKRRKLLQKDINNGQNQSQNSSGGYGPGSSRFYNTSNHNNTNNTAPQTNSGVQRTLFPT